MNARQAGATEKGVSYRTMKTSHLSLVLAASLLAMFSYSGLQEQKWAGTVEEKDGVRVVRNPREPIYKDDILSLVEELSIGYAEGKEERMFTNINDLAVDANENIYLLDLRQGQIRAFDKNGRYLGNIGQRGQGPGEFQFPVQILISPGQEVVIGDLMASRLLFFSPNGTFRKSLPTWKHGRPIKVLLNSEGNIIGEIPLSGEKKGFSLRKFNLDFEELFTIAVKEREKIPLLEDLSARIIWSVSENDNIIWGDSEKYEINVLDRDGKLQNIIIKEFDPEQIVEEEYREQIKTKFGGRPIPPDFDQELPRHYPAFRALETDDQGRLLVRTFEKVKRGKGYYLDVFSPESKYIAKIPLRAQAMICKKGKLYTVEEDQNRFPVMKRYGLKWKIN
jgi:hypothetical protein